jgi:hypothetical protein
MGEDGGEATEGHTGCAKYSLIEGYVRHAIYMPEPSFTFHPKHSLHCHFTAVGGDDLELIDLLLLLPRLEHLHRRVVTMVSSSLYTKCWMKSAIKE